MALITVTSKRTVDTLMDERATWFGMFKPNYSLRVHFLVLPAFIFVNLFFLNYYVSILAIFGDESCITVQIQTDLKSPPVKRSGRKAPRS